MFLRWGRKKSWSFLCISCNRILLNVVHFRCHKWPYLILYRYKIKPSIVKHHSLTVENLASWPEQQFLYGICSGLFVPALYLSTCCSTCSPFYGIWTEGSVFTREKHSLFWTFSRLHALEKGTPMRIWKYHNVSGFI